MTLLNPSMLIMLSFIMALLSLMFQFTHFLMSLFCLEAMLLASMLLLSSTYIMNNMIMYYIALLMLTLGACEASIGLSLTVNMSRFQGDDMTSSLSTLKC